MIIDAPEILKAIGPAASIIFAAWIFMGFLQQRYDAAVGRYIALIEQFRSEQLTPGRRKALTIQIQTYKKRCDLMNVASIIGLISAIFLISSLVAGELSMLEPQTASMGLMSAGAALIGFMLVILAAVVVLIEGAVIHRQLRHQLLDADLPRN